MSTDLRTTLNACDNATGFTGDGPTPAVNTTTGQRYEGSGSIESQHTNADEQMHTTSIGGTRDLSASTVYMLLKDNLVNTYANGGTQFVLGDATDLIGYDIAGNNATGLPLVPFYNAYKLDVSVVVATPGSFNAYAGTEAGLDQTAITRVGVGTLHLAKAVGNVANIFLDRMSFHANNAYALRINGGTVGTPETMADVQGDDVTNGWGLINNPLGSQYGFFGSTEWGEPAANADAYFSAIGEQWYWIGGNGGGRLLGTGNFLFRVVGNATDTISFVLDNVVIVNTGTRAIFDMSSADVNTLQLDAVTFTNIGSITFPANTASKHCNDSIFNNCGQVYLDDLTCDNLVFNGSNDALGAVLWDENSDPSAQDNLTFNSDGTGHAIHINLTGDGPGVGGAFTFDIDGYEVTGYETTSDGSTGNTVFLVDNNNDNDVTINVVNGTGTFSYERAAGYTGTVTINQTVTVTITVVDAAGSPIEGAKVFLEETGGTDIIPFDVTDVNGEVTTSYAGSTPQNVTGFVRKGTSSPVYKASPINATISASGLDATITLIEDE